MGSIGGLVGLGGGQQERLLGLRLERQSKAM